MLKMNSTMAWRATQVKESLSDSEAVADRSSAVWRTEAGRSGDHHAACHFLASMQCAPSEAEFQSQLDDPYYEPSDRLICRLNGALVGHSRLVSREMRFGAATLPISNLTEMLVLPEYRRQGCGTALLNAAEMQMSAEGALIGLVRTQQPRFFSRRGWCVWTRHSYSIAQVREVLSQLLPPSAPCHDEGGAAGSAITIRLWRQIETTGLSRIYAENTQTACGALARSDAYWQWLLSRRGFSRIYVAIQGPDRFDLDEGAQALVGYAVIKDSRILELMASPGCPQAATRLLARACADTLEQNGNYLRLDAPVGDPLHHIMACAGGELGYHEAVDGEACLIKLFDVPRLVEQLGEQLLERARAARIAFPFVLGFIVGGDRFVLEIRSRSVKLYPHRQCRSYLECGRAEWTQLLLGHLDLRVALASQRVIASTRIAADAAAALLPRLPLWRPPWDEVPAR